AGGAFVAALYDQSGNGRHAVQSSQARQPALRTDGDGALRNYAAFDGGNDWLDVADALNHAGLTLLFVHRIGDAGSLRRLFGSASNHRIYLGVGDAGGGYWFGIGGPETRLNTAGATDAADHVLTAWASQPDMALRLDGVEESTGLYAPQSPGSGQNIGSQNEGNATFFDGRLYEAIAWGAGLGYEGELLAAEADASAHYFGVAAGSTYEETIDFAL